MKTELVAARVQAIAESGAVACGAVTPQRAAALVPAAAGAGLDVLVIAGTAISAEHVRAPRSASTSSGSSAPSTCR